MQEVYLCLDVGGTEIKAAPLDKRGNFLAPVRHFPAMAGADRQTLLENFGWIFSSICPENAVPIEIDLAFPGPFDYKNGICLLQGLDKYDALYGCNLRRAFSEISGLPEQRIQFINDAAAFALGEMTFGQATQAGRALFVAVGTGCGSAFGVNGFLAEEGTPGVPPNGYFYNAPFRDSCVDDYISRRGWKSCPARCWVCRWMVVRLLNASPPGTNGPKPVSGALVNSCAMHCSRRSKHSVRTRSAWGDRLWQARHYFCTRWKNFVQTRRLLYILHRILLCGLCRG